MQHQARMIRQAKRNAEEELDRRLAESSTTLRNLRELAAGDPRLANLNTPELLNSHNTVSD